MKPVIETMRVPCEHVMFLYVVLACVSLLYDLNCFYVSRPSNRMHVNCIYPQFHRRSEQIRTIGKVITIKTDFIS